MKITSDQGTVTLIQGEREQSVWRRDNPDYLVNSYARLIALASLTWSGYVPQRKGRALIIGLGGGILCRFLIRHFSNLAIEVVEPSQKVVNIARQHFDLDHRVRVHVTDGRSFMSNRTGTFDIIVLDAFDKTYVPAELMTAEFLQAVRKRLRPEGLVIANTWVLRDITRHEDATYASVFKTVWDLRNFPNMDGNRILLHNPDATNTVEQIENLVKSGARTADERFPLPSEITKNRLYYTGLTEKLRIQPVQTQKNGVILTDANIKRVRAVSSFDD